MSNINPIYNDRVRYTLKNKNFNSLIITEPIGWNDDEKEYARHENYHGIIAKFSNSLKFIGSGADYIQLVLDVYGINEEIKLIREEKHPYTDVWSLTYSGYLDLSTWVRENNQVSVKFNSGGLEQLLKSRESEKVEIDRDQTIDGKTISPLSTVNVELEGRRIFLKSKWEVKPPDNYANLYTESNAGNVREQSVGIPFKLINKSHENAQDVLTNTNSDDNGGTTGIMFFAVSDRNRILKIDLSFQFKYSVDESDLNLQDCNFWIYLAKYVNGSNYNNSTKIQLLNLFGHAVPDSNGQFFNVNYTGQINLNIGESLSVEAYSKVDFNVDNDAHLGITLSDISGYLKLEEDSFQEMTNTKAILAHEFAERLVTINTNKEKSFYSELLGRTDIGYSIDGKAALTAFTHGFWVRGFDKLPIPTEEPPKIENLFKPLTTSFKEFVESMSAVWNIGIGIENVGYKEVVRLESLSYFYNRTVTIKLPNQVKNVKRTIATDKYYSSIEIGYEKGGNYEEACGLDEFNVKATYTTSINRIKNVYNKVSKYRADSYAMEFARRKQKSLNDTEDTTYDNDVFFLDLKKILNGLFRQRKYQDDFETLPTGIFSPETATNLRFSPFNCMLRHGWWISGSLRKYLTEYVRYASSVSNSQLKTKLIGSNEYSENGNIVNSELEFPRFIPEEIEFEHVCNFDIMQQVNGNTIILGKKIPNFYGLVEFINEKNEIEKGFLINLKPNGKGTWKLLKANR